MMSEFAKVMPAFAARPNSGGRGRVLVYLFATQRRLCTKLPLLRNIELDLVQLSWTGVF